MGTKFVSVSKSGYNASPPADDGTVAASNQVNWAKHKTKLSDPIADQVTALQAALTNHFNEGPDAKSVNYTTVAGDFNKVLNVTASATISLISVASVSVGYKVTVYNSHSSAITVDLANASDALDGTTNGSVSIPSKGAMQFMVSASGNYISFAQTRNSVDLSSTQTITGDKTFTGTVDLSGSTLTLPDDSVTAGILANAIAPRILVGDTGVISAEASVSLNAVFSSTYDAYDVEISGLVPATDNVALHARLGVSTTPDSGASDYNTSLIVRGATAAASLNEEDPAATSAIVFSNSAANVGSDTGEHASGTYRIYNANSSSLYTTLQGDTNYISAAGALVSNNIASIMTSAKAHTDIQFYFSSGNIESGRIRVYGLTNGAL